MARHFPLDHLADLVLHAERGGEEVAEWHDLAGRQHHVLLGRCSADGRFVHPDQRADLGSGQRHQVLDAVLQIVTLPVDEALRDAVQRGAPAVDVIDEKARPAHVFANAIGNPN